MKKNDRVWAKRRLKKGLLGSFGEGNLQGGRRIPVSRLANEEKDFFRKKELSEASTPGEIFAPWEKLQILMETL